MSQSIDVNIGEQSVCDVGARLRADSMPAAVHVCRSECSKAARSRAGR